jgi:fibronectin type 3 domain-containing protein
MGPPEVQGYVVKRANGPGGPFLPVAHPSSASYTDTGLTNGTTYYFTVAAVVAGQEGPDSVPSQAAPLAPPASPTGVLAAAANGKVALTWTATPGAAKYCVKRATSPAGPFSAIVSPSTPSHTDTELVNGTTYTYVVSALNAGGESPPSAPVSATPLTPPGAPSELLATAGNATVALVWSGVPGALNYRVMRSTTSGGPYTAIASPAGLSHLDTTVTNGTTYYYVVRAVNPGGKGPHSGQAQAMPVAPPPAPIELSAVPANSQVTLAWAAAPRATAYLVKRATSAQGPFGTVGSPTETSFTDAETVNGTPYWYVICGVNSGGEGPASAAVEVIPVAPPAAPAEVFATPGSAQITLAWAATPRARLYTIKRAATPAGPFATVGTVPSPPFTDINLSNGTTYHYLVTAANAGGESATSPVVSAAPVAPPAMPSGLAAQPGHGRVSLAWSASTRAASYVVRRATAGSGPWTTVASPAATSFVDTTVTNGTSYQYSIAAANAGGESPPSAPVEGTPVAPPAVPTGLSATPGNGQVVLAWAPSTRATSYGVRRSPTPGGPWQSIATTAAPSHVDGGLLNGARYYYVVSAANAGGESALSLQAECTPVAPPASHGSLTATPGNGQVTLAWPPAPGATGYTLRRSVNPAGPWATVASPSGTTFVDSPLTNGDTYFYIISALNAGGESSPSAPVEATPVAPPPPPGGLTCSPGNGRVALSWNAVDSATRYRVRRAAAPTGPMAEIASPVGPSYVDLTVTNGTTYWYSVAAANAGGDSPTGVAVPAAPVAPPTAPTGLAAVPANGRITISWTPSPRATSYTIRRATTPAGPYSTVAITASPAHSDGGLMNGVTYFYAVNATNPGGESPDSSAIRATPVAPPTAPSGLNALAGNSQITLSWTAVLDAAAYVLKRADQPAGPYSPVASPPGISHVDTDLENGKSYSYTVAAVNAGGEGPSSAPASATPLSAPDSPQRLVATGGNAHVTLSWTGTPGASGYVVKRSTTPGGPFTPVAHCSDPSCDDGMVTNGATYYYVISAINPGGESPDSLAAEARPVAPPGIPTGLACTPGNGQIQLAWTAASGAQKYLVKRSFDRRGPFLEIGSVGDTSFVDRNLQNGTAYYYLVTAANAGGESTRSSRVGGVPVAPPLPPGSIVARAGNGEVTLSWDASDGARRYRIKRSLDRRGPYTAVAVTADLTLVDRNVANGTTYHYIVSAFNIGGASPYSIRVSATPTEPPSPPPGLAATPGNSKVSLLWTAVPGSSHYRVYRADGPEGAWSKLAEVGETAFVDAPLDNGRRLSYVVRAVNAGGESPDSPRAEVIPAGPPSIPAGLSAAPGDAHVTLLWKASPGTACYSVSRATEATGPYTPIASPTSPAYTDTGLANDTRYYYRVRAFNPAGESGDTPPLEATPRPVRDLPPLPESPPGDGPPVEGTNGDLLAAVMAPAREAADEELLEARIPIRIPGAGRSPSSGIDLEKVLDLKRVDRLRTVYEGTAQKIEVWEVLSLTSSDPAARREMERLLRLKQSGDSPELHDGAVVLFEKLLKVRSESGALVRETRSFLGTLDLREHEREAMEIALGFLLAAPRGRKRAQAWVEQPGEHRREAGVYMEHALSIADRYLKSLRSR